MQYATTRVGADTPLPRPYPRSITDASNRATDERIGAIASLPPLKARMLLQKIIRSVCIHDFTKPAHISNQTFIQTLGVSLRTVCRLKVELEHAGVDYPKAGEIPQIRYAGVTDLADREGTAPAVLRHPYTQDSFSACV